jgi:hypothetical protein
MAGVKNIMFFKLFEIINNYHFHIIILRITFMKDHRMLRMLRIILMGTIMSNFIYVTNISLFN